MRYFFNLAGAIHDPDDHGAELADAKAARIFAVVHASEIIRDRPELVWLGDEVRVEVTDEQKAMLFTVIVLGVEPSAETASPKAK